MFVIEVNNKNGDKYASLYGSNLSRLALETSHRFSGALMPSLRAARAQGKLTRTQYKRAKDKIEFAMREHMQYDASRSFPYRPILMRDVRNEVRRLERIAA